MSETRSPLATTAGLILFTCLFPGMFLYHYLGALRLHPMYLGGFWGWVTVAGAAVMTPFLIRDMRSRQSIVFAALTFIVAGTALYHVLFGLPWQKSDELFKYSILLIFAWITLYGIGAYFQPGLRFRSLMLGSFLLMTGMTLVPIDLQTASFIALERFNAPAEVADYQWFALSFAIVATYCLSSVRGWAEVSIAATSVGILYILSSRSELYGFIAILLVWSAKMLIDRRALQLVATGAATLAILVSIVFLPQLAAPTVTAGGNARQAEVLNLRKSQSLNERVTYLKRGWNDIVESPVFGVYGGQMKDGQEFGSYIHNGLDMWRQYGLVAFILFAAAVFLAAFTSIKTVLVRGSRDNYWLFSLYMSIFSAILIILTKGIFWPIPALAWGLVAGLKAAEPRAVPA